LRPDRSDFRDRQLVLAVALGIRLSLFPHHIGAIVLNGAKKEMRGVDAGRVIAAVEYP